MSLSTYHSRVVYQEHDQHNIIIAGVFHERMDVPTHVRALARATHAEIDAIRRRLPPLS